MSGVKKILTAVLLVAFLLPATAVTELFKLPQLVQHYYHHRAEGNKTGFMGYLIRHYFIENGTDKDAAEDSRLPFKNSEQILSVMVIAVNPPEIGSITPVVMPLLNKNYIVCNDNFHAPLYLAAIWQPPRLC
jgi:hypothetical protein